MQDSLNFVTVGQIFYPYQKYDKKKGRFHSKTSNVSNFCFYSIKKAYNLDAIIQVDVDENDSGIHRRRA